MGIHSIGLVPIIEIQDLNDFGYGLTSWNGVQVYSNGRTVVEEEEDGVWADPQVGEGAEGEGQRELG